jgi:hypothetical protein
MLVSSAPPASAALAQVLPSASPCPQAVTGLVTFAIDPSQPIAVKTSQSFLVALRVVADAGYSWRLRPPTQSAVVRYERVFMISDVSYTNADRPPRAPGGPPQFPMVGGESTQYFSFTVVAPGTATLIFDLYGPGKATAASTKTFAVSGSPNVPSC